MLARSGWIESGTSPFRFYQFWLNPGIQMSSVTLKYCTLLDSVEINDLEIALANDPTKREAQRELAQKVTRAVHGNDGLIAAERATDILFNEGEVSGIDAESIEAVFSDAPSFSLSARALSDRAITLIDLMTTASLAPSKAEARRVIESGGIQVNGRRRTDPWQPVLIDDTLGGRFLVVRRGVREHRLAQVR